MNRNLTKGRTVYAKWAKAPVTNVSAVLFPKSPNITPMDMANTEVKQEVDEITTALGVPYKFGSAFTAEILEADKRKCEVEVRPAPTNAVISWSAEYYTTAGGLEAPVKKDASYNQSGTTAQVLLPIASEDFVVVTYTAKVGSVSYTGHALIVVKKTSL